MIKSTAMLWFPSLIYCHLAFHSLTREIEVLLISLSIYEYSESSFILYLNSVKSTIALHPINVYYNLIISVYEYNQVSNRFIATWKSLNF